MFQKANPLAKFRHDTSNRWQTWRFIDFQNGDRLPPWICGAHAWDSLWDNQRSELGVFYRSLQNLVGIDAVNTKRFNAPKIKKTISIKLIIHRRSAAKRGGCFQQCLFVCVFVCLSVCLFVSMFVHTIASERLKLDYQTWRLGTLYKNLARVRRSRSKVKGQGHQRQKKRKTAESSPL